MQPLSWYVNRLSLMSPAEVAWRAVRIAGGRIERRRVRGSIPPAQWRAVRLPPWSAPPQVNAEEYLEAANRLLRGEFELFGETISFEPQDIEWNRDPLSAIRAPMTPGKRIDVRDTALVGSVRNIWEINRHYQLVTLAQAYALSGEEKFREAALSFWGSWLSACPYPLGVNWASALESGIRLINWSIAARLLSLGSHEFPLREAILKSVYLHCDFIAHNFSRFSSANNHLIGEMCGLYVGATSWPCWQESQGWQRFARRILLREAERQVHEDGVGREQTTGYQMFVLQFLLFAGLAGEQTGDPFPREYWYGVRRMLRFLRSIADRGGHVPDFGDNDDGMAFMLAPRARERRLADLLDLDAAYSGLADLDSGSSSGAWLLRGFPTPSAWPSGPMPERRAFPQGGYYVLGCNRGQEDEVHAVLDAGPLGYLSICAHGHADCLSFVLSIGGVPLLIDPGTYAYHGEPIWRDYFRSTAAHNTLRVDGQDQSEMGGPFMWLRKAAPTVELVALDEPVQIVRARHDGYTRLPDSVAHTREFRLDGKQRTIEIIDSLRCRETHDIERFWHFAPHCTVRQRTPRTVEARAPGVRLTLTFPEAGSIRLFQGSFSPLAGWYSPRFGVRQPTTTVVALNRISGPRVLNARIHWERIRDDQQVFQ